MFENDKLNQQEMTELAPTEVEKKFTPKKAKEQLSKRYKKAKELLADDEKMEHFLQRLEKKLKMIPIAGEKLSKVPIMASLLKNYFRKEYREVPVGTMIAVTAALIYFVSPIDVLPDSIPIIGYSDDAAVVAVCWKLAESDINEYITWRDEYYKDKNI